MPSLTRQLRKKQLSWLFQNLDNSNSVYQAGVLEPVGPIESTSVDDWRRLYDINLFAVVELIKHSLPHFEKKPMVRSLLFPLEQPQSFTVDGTHMVPLKAALESFDYP